MSRPSPTDPSFFTAANICSTFNTASCSTAVSSDYKIYGIRSREDRWDYTAKRNCSLPFKIPSSLVSILHNFVMSVVILFTQPSPFLIKQLPFWCLKTFLVVFTARRSYDSAVLGVVILSVRTYVCLSHACFVTKSSNVYCGYFDTVRKGNHSSFLTVVSGRRPFRLKFALKVIHPLRKTPDFDRFPLITSQP